MRLLLVRLQNQAVRVLGVAPARRTPIVRAMLRRVPGDSAGYWLQLVISTALATLGLALDSTAVVIGAMLIAPLMRPIVELAMGLATGSTPLVLRTVVRAGASVAVAVAASAIFTWMLPFHEDTAELLARTAPSLLDLFVAAACAIAGAYAIVVSTNEVATTAAGTSIGISLIPPLCTTGYALATRDWTMAKGAALLFTANLTGIITVAGAVFVLVGFGQVDIREEERSLDDETGIGKWTRAGRSIQRGASARLGAVSRIVLPLALLAGIAFPLGRAVDVMSDRSTVRKRVAAVLSGENRRVLQYSLEHTARGVVLRVVLVGDPAGARAAEAELRDVLAAAGAEKAAVSVWAVPDALALSALSARLEDVPAVVEELPPPPPPPPKPPLATRIRDVWPTAAAGPLVSVAVSDEMPRRAQCTHLGAELGASGRELLAASVTDEEPVVILEWTLEPVAPATSSTDADWLQRMLRLLDAADEHPSLHVCITVPAAPRRGREAPERALVRAIVEKRASERILLRPGTEWAAVPQLEPCVADASGERAKPDVPRAR